MLGNGSLAKKIVALVKHVIPANSQVNIKKKARFDPGTYGIGTFGLILRDPSPSQSRTHRALSFSPGCVGWIRGDGGDGVAPSGFVALRNGSDRPQQKKHETQKRVSQNDLSATLGT